LFSCKILPPPPKKKGKKGKKGKKKEKGKNPNRAVQERPQLADAYPGDLTQYPVTH
jgi:hypothetical protein